LGEERKKRRRRCDGGEGAEFFRRDIFSNSGEEGTGNEGHWAIEIFRGKSADIFTSQVKGTQFAE